MYLATENESFQSQFRQGVTYLAKNHAVNIFLVKMILTCVSYEIIKYVFINYGPWINSSNRRCYKKNIV
jgi:hypothetical protein